MTLCCKKKNNNAHLDEMLKMLGGAKELSGGLYKFSRVMTILYSLKHSDPSSFGLKELHEYEEKFGEFSNKELQNIIEKCDENYIKTHPNLIHAVVNLLIERDVTTF